MPSNTAVMRVGRLLEVCVDAGYATAADVDRLFDVIDLETTKLPAGQRQYVTVADWTRCPVMSPAAAERVVHRLARTNARILRSAALARNDSPAAVLQFLRLIREAKQPSRKLFFEARELVDWLGEILTDEEKGRLRQLLLERSQRSTG